MQLMGGRRFDFQQNYLVSALYCSEGAVRMLLQSGSLSFSSIIAEYQAVEMLILRLC